MAFYVGVRNSDIYAYVAGVLSTVPVLQPLMIINSDQGICAKLSLCPLTPLEPLALMLLYPIRCTFC